MTARVVGARCSSTDGHHGIETCRTAGRRKGGDEAGDRGEHQGDTEEPGIQRERKQRGTIRHAGGALPHHERAGTDGASSHGPTQPQQAALKQEEAPDLHLRDAHRAQDADLAGLLDHDDREHARDAERDGQPDEEADGRIRRRLRAHRREEVGVGADPAVGLDPGGGGDAFGDALRRIDIAHRDVDAADAAGQPQHALRRMQRDEGAALVGALVPQVEDADDRERDGVRIGSGAAGGNAQLVPHIHTEIPCQLVADHDVRAGEPGVPADDLLLERDDAVVELRFDPGDGDRTVHTAPHDERRTTRDRRDDQHFRHRADLQHDGLPLVDRPTRRLLW